MDYSPEELARLRLEQEFGAHAREVLNASAVPPYALQLRLQEVVPSTPGVAGARNTAIPTNICRRSTSASSSKCQVNEATGLHFIHGRRQTGKGAARPAGSAIAAAR